MIYGTLQNTPSLNRSSQPTACTEQVETCHTLLLRFDAPLPVLKIPAFRWIALGSRIHRSFWSHLVYLLLCAQCYIPDDGQRTCPKHV